jgi:hypothetical protein
MPRCRMLRAGRLRCGCARSWRVRVALPFFAGLKRPIDGFARRLRRSCASKEREGNERRIRIKSKIMTTHKIMSKSMSRKRNACHPRIRPRVRRNPAGLDLRSSLRAWPSERENGLGDYLGSLKGDPLRWGDEAPFRMPNRRVIIQRSSGASPNDSITVAFTS